MKSINIKTLTITIAFFASIFLPVTAFASDDWIYTDGNTGIKSYIDTDTIERGPKGAYFARVTVKIVNNEDIFVSEERWEFNRDEGDWYCGLVGNRKVRGIRVYDDERLTAILKYLRENI